MYAPSDSDDEHARASRDPQLWSGVSPTPIRRADPMPPVTPATPPNQFVPPIQFAPPTPYPPQVLPLRRATPAPARSGALLSLGSFALSVALYAALLGLPEGLGITVLLLIHELGHYIVIRAKGLPAGLPVFIPFIGAYVAMRRMPNTVRDDAVIALAGPLAGCLSALACVALYQVTGVVLFLSLALLGYVLNLLNLVPILPLDGGRVANAITPWLGPLAFLGIVAYAIATKNLVLFVLVIVFSLPSLARTLTISRKTPFFHVSPWARISIALAFVALAAILTLGMMATLAVVASRGDLLIRL